MFAFVTQVFPAMVIVAAMLNLCVAGQVNDFVLLRCESRSVARPFLTLAVQPFQYLDILFRTGAVCQCIDIVYESERTCGLTGLFANIK